jgi:hypothetical protein
MIARVHGRTVESGLPHLIDFSSASADTFRRFLALNVTRMPDGGRIHIMTNSGHVISPD